VILENFAVGEDAHKVAAIKHQGYLHQATPGFDPVALRNILEASNSLIEFHLHGPVTRAHVLRIVMPRALRNHYWELSQRASALSMPWPQEYDIVPFFLELVRLMDMFNIPFLVSEDN
jgi:hypothetical protein